MKNLKYFIAFVLVAACLVSLITIACIAGASHDKDDDVNRCMDEIEAMYGWEHNDHTDLSGFTAQKLDLRLYNGYEKDDPSDRFYIVVVYVDEPDAFHRYEFVCQVNNHDVDCELVRDDVCEGY